MPTDYTLLLALGVVTQLVFAFAFGACAGSLINVLVYRLPRGISVVSPPSRCPSCAKRLTWRENIPVLGWVLLRGRCRFCRAKISAEYPIVEAFVGLLFAGLYALWYVVPDRGAVVLGVDWGTIRPEWALNGFLRTWPSFVSLLVLVSCLVAMTIIDARTFTIPLVLTWTPAVVGALAHSGHALYLDLTDALWRHHARGQMWSIMTPGQTGWGPVGLAAGGLAGLVVANVLLAMGVLRRSFGDYDEWEASVSGAGDGGNNEQSPAEVWIQYPHARREVCREAAFLAPAVILGMIGWWVAVRLTGPWTVDPITYASMPAVGVPHWASVAAGVGMGYLVGGGLVWGIRIFGTLAFGKEAMGLGDVHLLAAVGACLGWLDAVLTFFAAPFIALLVVAVNVALTGGNRRAMPYGPYLAGATLLVVLGKVPVELLLTRVFGSPVRLDFP